MKRENAILTYTNTLFYPLAPVAAEVKLEDIAHALAQMCRANGHFKTFYSVAQHSLNCAREAKARGLPERLQLACLLHDASEAYISDITRPVKHYLEDYKRIERNLQQVIYKRLGISDLTEIECGHIGEIDNALLDHEFKALHYQGLMKNSPRLYAPADFAERSMRAVEQEFLIAAGKLLDNKKTLNKAAGVSASIVAKKQASTMAGLLFGWRLTAAMVLQSIRQLPQLCLTITTLPVYLLIFR